MIKPCSTCNNAHDPANECREAMSLAEQLRHSLAAFTPGPWDIDGAKDHDHHYHEILGNIPTPREASSEFNFTVADTLNRDHRISPDEDLANARLIAAAPDMYAALKAIAYLNDHALTAMPRGEQVAMVKAIAKAEGK